MDEETPLQMKFQKNKGNTLERLKTMAQRRKDSPDKYPSHKDSYPDQYKTEEPGVSEVMNTRPI